jgi:hypothetical protein
MWVRSLLIDEDRYGNWDSIETPVEYSRRSSRSSASLVLNCTFFAFWYISDSVLPPHPPPAVVATSISANKEREGLKS